MFTIFAETIKWSIVSHFPLYFIVPGAPLFTGETDKKSLSVAMKLLYLDAIVTDEGKQRLNELKEKYQYNNI